MKPGESMIHTAHILDPAYSVGPVPWCGAQLVWVRRVWQDDDGVPAYSILNPDALSVKNWCRTCLLVRGLTSLP